MTTLGPQEESIGQITEFQKLFLSPGFISYGSVLIAVSLVIIFYFAPRSVVLSIHGPSPKRLSVIPPVVSKRLLVFLTHNPF